MKKVYCMVVIILLFSSLFGCKDQGQDFIVENSIHFNLSNYVQLDSEVALTAFEGNLYLFSREESSAKISVFSDGGVDIVKKFKEPIILPIGFFDEYFYYSKSKITDMNNIESFKLTEDIYCYSLKTNEEKYLATVSSFHNKDVCWFEDGMLYIPVDINRDCDLEKREYYVISGDEVKGTTKIENAYKLGNDYYAVKGYNDEKLYRINDSERVDISNSMGYGYKSLIPCQNGLLVHNRGQQQILYFIDQETGEIINLYETECMGSNSSVNVFENYVFVSFERYEKYDDLDHIVGYENDVIQGTYRIDLNDKTVTKINDNIYRGMYVFGEGVIYAVDAKQQVFQLDFDGNCIEQLL